MEVRYGKLAAALLAVVVITLARSAFSNDIPPSPDGLAWLEDYQTEGDSLVTVVIFMEDEAARDDLSMMTRRTGLSRSSRITGVLRRLQSFKAQGSERVEEFVGRVSKTEVIRHWIVPAYTATISSTDIHLLSQFEGVKLIVPDVPLIAVEPVDVSASPSLSTTVSSQLELLRVPQLWALGLTGAGRLVASFDTGVEQPHPALAPKWRGNHADLSASWFSPIQPNILPYDNAGHGTHTMGIIVGSTVADTFGVAPGAEWITAGVVDQGRSLSATVSDIIQAFQWALNPDGDEGTTNDVPDVILNSWGIPAGIFSPCDQTFSTVIDNVEAAGILAVFAAGNEGPAPQSLRDPADRASGPLNTFSVGAVSNSKIIADFSSRGPSRCDANQKKPEVVAPGISVRSSSKDGTYTVMSGTSMAAPYVAGLALLARQYNPDATVDEIKSALIQSAEDLGPAGEDNAYGYGLVDAVRMLENLPRSSLYHFAVSGTIISGDGVACPGEGFDFQVVLTNASANVESLTGILKADDGGPVSITSDHAEFFFGDGGTTAINYAPFQLTFASTALHGQEITLNLYLADSTGGVLDTLELGLTVGYAPPGSIGEHASGDISFTVSDFGQFGFAPGSIYNLAGNGFRYAGSSNLLYEAGLIVGRNYLQLSSSIRDLTGELRPSDFTPIQGLSAGLLDSEQAFHRHARFVDSYSEIPIPVTIDQHTVDFAGVDGEAAVIFQYHVINNTLEKLTGLSFGFLADFDLSDTADQVVYDDQMKLIYQCGGGASVVGLVALGNVNSFSLLDNNSGKIGFSSVELYELISQSTNDVDTSLRGDLMFVASSGAVTLTALDSIEVAFALVAGDNVAGLYRNAWLARDKYDIVTSIEESAGGLPGTFVLGQNYPNPFNPTTSITFSILSGAEVNLEVFNVLGQRVRQLRDGYLSAGSHTVKWDARSDAGDGVASGVYLYRLTVDGVSRSRKMLLLR
ncbi:MAG TPA: S8 family serine peptidase [Acidobacteriota bacterium]|nr:S8 family serine peptidase [Acidobacteriota bacterium]